MRVGLKKYQLYKIIIMAANEEGLSPHLMFPSCEKKFSSVTSGLSQSFLHLTCLISQFGKKNSPALPSPSFLGQACYSEST